MQNNLAEIRKQNGDTRQELAKAMKTTDRTIKAIEDGKFEPSGLLMLRIAKRYGVPSERIFIIEDE